MTNTKYSIIFEIFKSLITYSTKSYAINEFAYVAIRRHIKRHVSIHTQSVYDDILPSVGYSIGKQHICIHI